MADIIDHGNETAEVFLDAALSKRKANGPRPNGRCHNCGAYLHLDGALRFCDAECRDDWEKLQQRT